MDYFTINKSLGYYNYFFINVTKYDFITKKAKEEITYSPTM